MFLSACDDEPSLVFGVFDLPLPLSALHEVLRRVEHEDVPLLLQLPSAAGWVGWLARARELPSLLEDASSAWVVQRPGCAGLVTRVVLLDGAGQALACVAAARDPGVSEPVAWRVILLMALLDFAVEAPAAPLSERAEAG